MLVTLRRFLPQFREMTITAIYRGVDRIQNGVSSRGTPFSRNTKIDFIAILKQFTIWLIDKEEIIIPEKKIRVIKAPKILPTRKASDLLNGDEIQALVTACHTSRDRALIMTMYEGGFRVETLILFGYKFHMK